jgi:hypothetical protein
LKKLLRYTYKEKEILVDNFLSKSLLSFFLLLTLRIYNVVDMPKYSKKAQDKVGEVMHEFKEGKLKSGRSGKKVKSRKQAVAIGLSEARKKGAKVPKK